MNEQEVRKLLQVDPPLPVFSDVEEAEEWVGKQVCKGGECEAEVAGDRYVPLYCWRHGQVYEIADRLFTWQQGRGK